MKFRGYVSILALLLPSAPASYAQPEPPRPAPAKQDTPCSDLMSPSNARKFSTLPDAPTAINSARIVPAGGTHGPADDDLPEYCRVEGVIAPTIGFLVRMPTKTWNGKFMMGGCGGPCGNYLEDRIDPALARNYAVVTTDMGHKGASWLFGYNNPQGQIDFAYRATHLTAVVGKQIVKSYYGQAAAHDYYYGCSTGGRQGMLLAQRFPDDFEGIIAGAPVYDEVGDSPYFLEWNNLINSRADGTSILTVEKLSVIHQAVMDKCDLADGVKDGLLQDPLKCAFDPKTIICKAGANPSTCLSPEQAEVAQKIHDGARNSKGEKLYWGMPWGSEDQWAGAFVSPTGRQRDVTGTSITGYMGYGASPGATYKISDFDYDRDPARMKLTGTLYNVLNPDLSEFNKRGGKLILFHGYNDNNIPVEASLSYYRSAVKANGGLVPTKAFFRFFLMPGVNHCRGGEGGGEADWISALENWVEKDKPPEVVTAVHPKAPYPTAPRALEDYGSPYLKLSRFPMATGEMDRARPVFAYPDQTRYSGHGDPKSASSWSRAADASE